jgi:hypothetical protein
MPAEHGAWGILIVPFLCAAVVAAASSNGSAVPLTLAAVSVLGVFLLRGSLQSHGHWRALFLPAHLALAVLAAAAAALLMFLYDRYWLLAVAAGGLALYLLQCALTRNHQRHTEKRSLAAELVGVVLLTLSAPAATISVLGQLDARGLQVWLLNALFFLGGVLYVKYRVRGLLAHRPFCSLAERFRFAWPVFVYHLLLVLLLACAVILNSLPLLALVAFAPAVLRAHGLLFLLGRRFPIKRLGWSEIAHSVLFAVLLILASRA